jgi:transposase
MACAGVTLPWNTVCTRLCTTAGNAGVIWEYLRGSWKGLAAKTPDNKTISIDATYLKVHRTASSLRVKKGAWTSDWPFIGGINTKLHAVTDTIGLPIWFFMIAGQFSDYTETKALVSNLPAAEWLLGDRGYDADWFREALVNMGIKLCISGRKSRSKAIKYDKRRHKKRSRIEIMFGHLKDWRRVATRYDKCPKVFVSAIDLAASVLFWLWILSLTCSVRFI